MLLLCEQNRNKFLTIVFFVCIIVEQISFYCLPSPCNTLYLELHCPAVAPSVVVTSDNGKNTVDFGDVAVGMKSEFKH